MKVGLSTILLKSIKIFAALFFLCTLFFCDKYDLDRTNPNDPKSDDYYSLPVLNTKVVSDLNSNSATIAGEITYDGGSPVVARGFCWSTSQLLFQ